MKKLLSLCVLLNIFFANAQLTKEYIETKHFNTNSQFETVKNLLSKQPKTYEEARKFYLEITPQVFMLERLMWEEDCALRNSGLSQKIKDDFEKQNKDIYGFFLNSLHTELKKVDKQFGLDFSKVYMDYKLSVSPGIFYQAIHQKTLLENLKKGLTPQNLKASQEEATKIYADFEAMNIIIFSIKAHAKNNKFYSAQHKIVSETEQEIDAIYNEIMDKTF